MNAPIRLLVVDDHTLFRRGLVALLASEEGLEVVGEAADAGEALRRARELQPQVILLDRHLPGASGLAALPGLKEAAPSAQILMLTVSEDENDLVAALRAGARGYVLKTIDGAALADAIRRTVAGESVVSPEMTGKLVEAFRSSVEAQSEPRGKAAADPIDTLSPREREILSHIARGASNKVIARALGIAETTVKIHVQHILRKLELVSRVQAAVYAVERGIV
ncbi:MAG: response regulator [Limnobacter sp.]|nr:response regulator [Limnobacter sp.]